MPSEFELLIDLHLDRDRQGPGSVAETEAAIRLSGLAGQADLTIADIGCGTGAAALALARSLHATVQAVDFVPAFLTALDERAAAAGLQDMLVTTVASMENLPFAKHSLDAIWSEGAVYNLGFERGIRLWQEFLKPGGVLAVSELTWFSDSRPADLEQHWRRAYPEVDTAANKIRQLEAAGYELLGYFPLPEYCWLENYYRPLEASFGDFVARHGDADPAKQLVASEIEEIRLYERYSEYFGYGYYVGRLPTPKDKQ